jgi:hypothetical protein
MEVQQQTGTDDCGLFACAYLELISQAKNPSSYTFNQVNMRNKFDTFLKTNTFEGFGGVYHAAPFNVISLECDWQISWDDRSKSIRENAAINRANPEIISILD